MKSIERIKEWIAGLFPHAKPVRYILLLFTFLVVLAWATQCRGEEPTATSFEVGTSVGHGGYTPAVAFNVVFPRVAKDADIECGLILIGRNPPYLGTMGAQCLVVDGFGRFDLGVGGIYLNKTDYLNGSQLNFALKASYRLTRRCGLVYRHISNSGTTSTNTGRDAILGWCLF